MAAAVNPPSVDEVFDAAERGDLPLVKLFLDAGGDVDQGLLQPREVNSAGEKSDHDAGATLLMAAAGRGHVAVMRLLIARGADVNLQAYARTQYRHDYNALLYACIWNRADAVQLLLDSGADTSTNLVCCRIEETLHLHEEFTIWSQPRIVRILLVAGMDLTRLTLRTPDYVSAMGYWIPPGPSQTLDELAREDYEKGDDLINNCSWRDTYPDAYDRMAAEYACDMPNWAETATILEGARLAGHSYKQWVLGPYKKLLRLRSQVARGYATIAPETPPVVARLFGLPGVPDPCFWLVVEYAWLGDWRRP